MTTQTPKLRFPEFSDNWEVKKLKDIYIDVIDGDRGANYPNGDDFSEQGYCLFLNAKNVTKNGFSFTEKAFITKEKDENLRKGKLQRFDIVLTTRGSVGHIAYYNSGIYFEHLRINSGMVIIRGDAKYLNLDYLYKYFNSNQIQNEISKIAFGSAQPQLTVSEILKLKIQFPQLPEQTKIANFLTAIDEKIQALKQKKTLLEQYKKGIMQQIFSQELRFKNDDGTDFDDWEEKSLGEITEIYDGTHQTPNYVSEGIPFYSVEHITANDFSKTKFITKEVYEKENKRVKLERGDILMTKIGDIGTSKYIDWDVIASFYVSLALIKSTELNNTKYLNQFFKTEFFQKELHQRIIHVAFPKKINLGEISNCLVQCPTLPEQQKIANFLTAIDEKIEKVSQQISSTETYKKGLLQQMFI